MRDIIACASGVLQHGRNLAPHLTHSVLKVSQLHAFIIGDPTLVIADVKEKSWHTQQSTSARRRLPYNRSGCCETTTHSTLSCIIFQKGASYLQTEGAARLQLAMSFALQALPAQLNRESASPHPRAGPQDLEGRHVQLETYPRGRRRSSHCPRHTIHLSDLGHRVSTVSTTNEAEGIISTDPIDLANLDYHFA